MIAKCNESKLVVGSFYLVPCYFNHGQAYLPKRWIPVVYADATHEDTEIGVPHQHLHYDTRFMPDKDLYMVEGQCYSTALVQKICEKMTFEELIQKDNLSWKRRKCYRKEQLFPDTDKFNDFVQKVERCVDGLSLNLGNMVCPHKGISIKNCAQKVANNNSIFVCPRHGLRWDAKTGDLVKSPARAGWDFV